MKGVIIAGGLATRLRPLTLVTNKHLLPVFNKPMIYYPLEAMKKAGIKEVLLTTSGDHVGHFANLLKTGDEFDLRLYYAIQKNPKGGIADALSLAREFARNDSTLVILGDNIFNFSLIDAVRRFEKQKTGAKVFGVMLDGDCSAYGVIEIGKDGKLISIEEKPTQPKSNIIQTGIYMYDNRVFDIIPSLTPSGRGELEVTDVNMFYLKEGNLTCELIDWWIDAGASYEELLRAGNDVKKMVDQGKL